MAVLCPLAAITAACDLCVMVCSAIVACLVAGLFCLVRCTQRLRSNSNDDDAADTLVGGLFVVGQRGYAFQSKLVTLVADVRRLFGIDYIIWMPAVCRILDTTLGLALLYSKDISWFVLLLRRCVS